MLQARRYRKMWRIRCLLRTPNETELKKVLYFKTFYVFSVNGTLNNMQNLCKTLNGNYLGVA